VYTNGHIQIGIPEGMSLFVDAMARANTEVCVGAQEGDEGKGRIVDNRLYKLVNKIGIKIVNVVRFQGGSNAGHTLVKDDGTKIALHQVPSGVLYEEAVGIMDSGMVINVEDLRTEVEGVEEIVGDLRGKLILSKDAMLNTDLERAMEVLNRELSSGKSSGGTGKGMAPTVAGFYDRTGLGVKDLMAEDWREKLGNRYDTVSNTFSGHQKDLSDMEVPDLKESKIQKTQVSRKLGTREDFLNRLGEMREWLIQRDLVKNTYHYHGEIYNDASHGIMFEGAQAVGLDPHFGRRPDVTVTPTGVMGVQIGTRRPEYSHEYIPDRIGVGKITYMSSVGAVRMITDSGLERKMHTVQEINAIQDPAQRFAALARLVANEKGTTTQRPRDICFADLPLLAYNIEAGKINQLALTHLDVARSDMPIKVCTHYENMYGEPVAYQPGIENQENLTPVYIELPGWNAQEAANARTIEELPENAIRYLAFVQAALGVPITMVTVGPKREAIIEQTSYVA
jgi:adenylosuccinate synthase